MMKYCRFLNYAIGLVLFSLSFSIDISAETPPAQVVTPTLEKNLSFDDMLVQGKYEFVDETVTTVEQDKVLDGLLQLRKDFRDKIKKSASRH